MVSSHEVLAEEAAMLEFARRGRMTCRPLGTPSAVADSHLNAGQRVAIDALLSSPDRVILLRGGAGTGKTTLMRATVAQMEAGGRAVSVFAPTSAATDVLRGEGFTHAETLQRLLQDEPMQKTLQGAVLWIDEAGLVSVPDMARLTRIADAQRCRLILSGDSRQHGAIARGDAMRLLETRAGLKAAEVTEIVRQDGAYRQAVSAVAKGDARNGFRQFDSMGAIIEREGPERFAAMASDYLGERRAGRTVLVVSPTHREKDLVTQHIRAALIEDGQLSTAGHRYTALRDMRWTEAQRGDAARYRGGEVVKFIQNAPGFGKTSKLTIERSEDRLVANQDGRPIPSPLAHAARFKVYRPDVLELRAGDCIRITENGRSTCGHRLVNGAIYHVSGFDDAGAIVLRENGWKVSPDFGHIDYGYCSTSVSAQGRTVDTVLVAMGRESVPAMSQEQFYVTVSRGRKAMRLYTDDREEVRAAIDRSGARGSATELLEAAVDRKGRPVREHLATYTEAIGRLYAARARDHAANMHNANAPPEPRVNVQGIKHVGVIGNNAAQIGWGQK